MDFVNNIWGKTGLKNKDQTTEESELPASDKTDETVQSTESAKDGTKHDLSRLTLATSC